MKNKLTIAGLGLGGLGLGLNIMSQVQLHKAKKRADEMEREIKQNKYGVIDLEKETTCIRKRVDEADERIGKAAIVLNKNVKKLDDLRYKTGRAFEELHKEVLTTKDIEPLNGRVEKLRIAAEQMDDKLKEIMESLEVVEVLNDSAKDIAKIKETIERTMSIVDKMEKEC